MDEVYLLLMENTLQVDTKLSRVFDLKGSLVARNVKVEGDAETGSKTLKDVNFLDQNAGLKLEENHMKEVKKTLLAAV